MNTREAYNSWSSTYDSVINKTRDLEANAIRSVLANLHVNRILELGCGTGKNTAWLVQNCNELIAADFSTDMLAIAREKLHDNRVMFTEADITRRWDFPPADLISCSLVLEHIENIQFIFGQAAGILQKGGQFYICELHPYRQLQGSRARFEKEGELLQLEYFIHHLSDYFHAASNSGFSLSDLSEWFDEDDKSQPARLVSFLFRKE